MTEKEADARNKRNITKIAHSVLLSVIGDDNTRNMRDRKLCIRIKMKLAIEKINPTSIPISVEQDTKCTNDHHKSGVTVFQFYIC